MESRENMITGYAQTLIRKYDERKSIKPFYEKHNLVVTGDEKDFFKKHARDYYLWLLLDVPPDYRAEVDARVQELRKSLKKTISGLLKEAADHIKSTLSKGTPPEDTELGTFGGGNKDVGRELWEAQEIGPPREDE